MKWSQFLWTEKLNNKQQNIILGLFLHIKYSHAWTHHTSENLTLQQKNNKQNKFFNDHDSTHSLVTKHLLEGVRKHFGFYRWLSWQITNCCTLKHTWVPEHVKRTEQSIVFQTYPLSSSPPLTARVPSGLSRALNTAPVYNINFFII